MANPTPTALVTLGGVIVCWSFFAGIFLLRKRPPQEKEAKRDVRATFGIVLQMCGYFLVWFQPPHTAFLPPAAVLSGAPGIVFAVFTISLAALSVWFMAGGANAGKAVGGGGAPGRGPQVDH